MRTREAAIARLREYAARGDFTGQGLLARGYDAIAVGGDLSRAKLDLLSN